MLCKHGEVFSRFAGARISIGNNQKLRARVDDQSLRCIKFAELICDVRIARFEFLNLPVHRDGFQPEFLFAIMFGDAQRSKKSPPLFARRAPKDRPAC